MGHKVARTRLGSINFVTGDVSYASTYAIIGTGAHGGVQPYPSNNVSYSYKARYFPINMHQAHKPQNNIDIFALSKHGKHIARNNVSHQPA